MFEQDQITVLIVDDHQLFRDGIKRILDMEPDITVVGEGADGEEAQALVEIHQPNVILMDINMPNMNGVEATQRIKELSPNSRIVILSIHDEEGYVYKTLLSGANGYLLKEMDTEALIEAIKVVARGEAYIHPKVTGKLIEEFRRLSDLGGAHSIDRAAVDPGLLDGLTNREKQVLQLMADGNSNRAIAEILYISEKTVKNHVSSILQKLNVEDRTPSGGDVDQERMG